MEFEITEEQMQGIIKKVSDHHEKIVREAMKEAAQEVEQWIKDQAHEKLNTTAEQFADAVTLEIEDDGIRIILGRGDGAISNIDLDQGFDGFNLLEYILNGESKKVVPFIHGRGNAKGALTRLKEGAPLKRAYNKETGEGDPGGASNPDAFVKQQGIHKALRTQQKKSKPWKPLSEGIESNGSFTTREKYKWNIKGDYGSLVKGMYRTRKYKNKEHYNTPGHKGRPVSSQHMTFRTASENQPDKFQHPGFRPGVNIMERAAERLEKLIQEKIQEKVGSV